MLSPHPRAATQRTFDEVKLYHVTVMLEVAGYTLPAAGVTTYAWGADAATVREGNEKWRERGARGKGDEWGKGEHFQIKMQEMTLARYYSTPACLHAVMVNEALATTVSGAPCWLM